MKKSIAKKWAEALRSGEYIQGRAALRRGDAYCCLGVLCDLYRIKHGGQWIENAGSEYSFMLKIGELPSAVMKWAGMKSPDAKIPGAANLAIANDELGYDFEMIADVVEFYAGDL